MLNCIRSKCLGSATPHKHWENSHLFRRKKDSDFILRWQESVQQRIIDANDAHFPLIYEVEAPVMHEVETPAPPSTVELHHRKRQTLPWKATENHTSKSRRHIKRDRKGKQPVPPLNDTETSEYGPVDGDESDNEITDDNIDVTCKEDRYKRKDTLTKNRTASNNK